MNIIVKTILEEYGGEKPNDVTWAELADRFGLWQDRDTDFRTKMANNKWRQFLGTKAGKEYMGQKKVQPKTIIKNQSPKEGDSHLREETDDSIITTSKTEERLYTVDDHIRFHKIDPEIWKPAKQVSIYWEMNGGGGEVMPLHQMKIWWERRDRSLEEFEEKRFDIEKAFVPTSYEAPKSGRFETWVVLFCVHVPFHNRFLFDAVCKYMQEHEVTGIILGGDFLDMKSISLHDVDKVQQTNLGEEYLEGHKAILQIESVLSENADKVFLYGNHEDRFNRLLKSNTYNKLGSAFVPPENALQLGEKGWKVLRNWKEDFVLLGNNLEVFHGTHTNKNAALSHLEKSAINNRSCLFGHTHRFQSASTGKYVSYNVGTLSDFDNIDAFGYVDRHIRQSWQHGFAIVHVDEQGEHYIQPVKCGKKGFFLDGKKY